MSIDEKAFQAAYDCLMDWGKVSRDAVTSALEVYEAAKSADQPAAFTKARADMLDGWGITDQPVGWPEFIRTLSLGKSGVEIAAAFDDYALGVKLQGKDASYWPTIKVIYEAMIANGLLAPERESGEEMVPKWSLDSQIEISNSLRAQLEACQKRLLEKSDHEIRNTPVTNFNLQRMYPEIKPLTDEQRDALIKSMRCDECGCSNVNHAPRCSKITEIEDEPS